MTVIINRGKNIKNNFVTEIIVKKMSVFGFWKTETDFGKIPI